VATLQEKKIRCGKTGCAKCPHGPYLYSFERVNGRLRARYIGKMSKQEYLESEAVAACPIDADTLAQASSVLAQSTYLIALDLLEICDDGTWDRERVRKRCVNRIEYPREGKAGDPTVEECFVAICKQKGWKLPRTIKNRKVGAM